MLFNLILGSLWFAAGVGVLGYEMITGDPVLRFHGLGISSGWFFFVLAGWNFVRWYSARAWHAEQEALRIAHEARLRQVRHRERPSEPDPNFDFSDKPSPPPPTDRPPSAN